MKQTPFLTQNHILRSHKKTTLRLIHANNLQLCSSPNSEAEKAAESGWTRDKDFWAKQREQEVHRGPCSPPCYSPLLQQSPTSVQQVPISLEWPTHWLDIFPSYWCYKIITVFSCNDICVCSRLLWRSDSRTRGHPCTPLCRGCCDIRRSATTQEALRQRAVTSAAFPTDLCVLQVLMTFRLSLSCSLKSPMREACFENASSWTSQSSLDMLSFLKVYNVYYWKTKCFSIRKAI